MTTPVAPVITLLILVGECRVQARMVSQPSRSIDRGHGDKTIKSEFL